MIKLIEQRTIKVTYYAYCYECDKEYVFHTALARGFAEYVSIFCRECRTYLGRVRDDYGSDKLLGPINESEMLTYA